MSSKGPSGDFCLNWCCPAAFLSFQRERWWWCRAVFSGNVTNWKVFPLYLTKHSCNIVISSLYFLDTELYNFLILLYFDLFILPRSTPSEQSFRPGMYHNTTYLMLFQRKWEINVRSELIFPVKGHHCAVTFEEVQNSQLSH